VNFVKKIIIWYRIDILKAAVCGNRSFRVIFSKNTLLNWIELLKWNIVAFKTVLAELSTKNYRCNCCWCWKSLWIRLLIRLVLRCKGPTHFPVWRAVFGKLNLNFMRSWSFTGPVRTNIKLPFLYFCRWMRHVDRLCLHYALLFCSLHKTSITFY